MRPLARSRKNNLQFSQRFRLANYITDSHESDIPDDQFHLIAAEASSRLGFRVTEHNIAHVLRALKGES